MSYNESITDLIQITLKGQEERGHDHKKDCKGSRHIYKNGLFKRGNIGMRDIDDN